jgi:Ca2+-transporting ATPase
VVCAVVFLAGVWRGEPLLLMLLTAVSLAVAAIPEALPAVVTVMLALGARTMAAQQALVRRLPAVETLGSVSFICTDKTGTLTLNEMRAVEVWVAGKRLPVRELDGANATTAQLLTAVALCTDAERDAQGEIVGDPTEVALWRAAAGAGFDKAALARRAPRLMEIPFDSDRKRMTTLHRDGSSVVAYTKGAPERVLQRCAAVLTDAGPLAGDRSAALAIADAMAGDGLRVLAVAQRVWEALPERADAETIERELTLIGLIGLRDPPRPEARQAVAVCRSAGITPVMITGDHPVTARAIAGELGMLEDDSDAILNGRDLEGFTDHDLAGVRVYARVDPAQKIRIVTALQERGHFVAMTGDGVNDAPALAKADVGVAMGKAAATRRAKPQASSSSTTISPPSSPPCAKAGTSSTTSANSSAMS